MCVKLADGKYMMCEEHKAQMLCVALNHSPDYEITLPVQRHPVTKQRHIESVPGYVIIEDAGEQCIVRFGTPDEIQQAQDIENAARQRAQEAFAKAFGVTSEGDVERTAAEKPN